MSADVPRPVACDDTSFDWLAAYLRLRHKQSSSRGARYLLYEADTSGFGDRVDGLLFALCLAALSERVLLSTDYWFAGYLRPKLPKIRFNASIHPPLPTKAHMFFTTNGVLPAGISVDVASPLIRVLANAGPHHAHTLENLTATRTPSGRRVAKLVGAYLTDRDRELHRLGSIHALELHMPSSCIFSSLLEMAPPLTDAITAARQDMFGNALQSYAAIHLRLGDTADGSSMEYRQCVHKTDERISLPAALSHVQRALEATNGLPLYVATDNGLLKAQLRRKQGVHVHGCDDCATHIASNRFARSAAPAKLMFEELGLLAAASVLLCPPGNPSRFFRTAVYLRGAGCTLALRGGD
uniref:O-fucosyltransferase family protein n=1 Tax=Calcidiscus leptoporus TaxID=127549 RepID=A0A7S0J763_9EUKA|mmetsp:Transcript_4297/g.9746  ORF Transcript_4297/g.9746 Transcript_4297/m.9746 type:complete len:354 (+) Transcript_4297:61-1122(+)